MKTEAEIRQELQEVRKRLAKIRAVGSDDTETLYGAQQALGWVLGELGSPSDLERIIEQTVLRALR